MESGTIKVDIIIIIIASVFRWWNSYICGGGGMGREGEREREMIIKDEEEVIMRLTDLSAKQLFDKSVREDTRTAPN